MEKACKKKKKITLITDSFPFGSGETFLIPEVPYLSEHFDLTIITANTKDPQTTDLSCEVKVFRINIKLSFFDRIKYLFLFLCNDVCRKEIGLILTQKKHILGRIAQSVSMYSMGTKWFWKVKKINKALESDLLYFYWYNDKLIGTALAFLEKKNRPKIITRVHGYDLYNERKKKTLRQPFKPLLDYCIDTVFFVSEKGYQYYGNTFGFSPITSYKIARLGVTNKNHLDNPHADENSLVMVSCSNIIPLKRVELIMKALPLIKDFRVKWIHIGDGIGMNALSALAKNMVSQPNSNFSFSFLGAISNQAIHEFYRTTPIDCFITTSSTEGGCPVSLQEAFAYGIPAIATSVGGIPEMILGNGILLPEDPTPIQIAEAIREIFEAKKNNTIKGMQKAAKSMWENSFNADVNFPNFCSALSEICSLK